MVEWRQAATLAAIALAVLAALVLAGAATADDGEQVAAAPAPLQPTQVVAEIPEGYNQLFPLQWGGGSLFQLKSRLATMGCIANTIWNHDDDQWHSYNQYNVPSTLNAAWLAAYGAFVPAGSLFATCFDVCEFNYFDAPRGDIPCESLADFRESGGLRGLGRYPIDDSTECTDDFDKRVKDHVLPSMPLYPGVCIFRQSAPSGGGHAYIPLSALIVGGYYPINPGFVVVYKHSSPHQSVEYNRAGALGTEIHELCHTNQFYHSVEQMRPDRLITGRLITGGSSSTSAWLTTEPGSSFIDLVGFSLDAAGDWSLLGDSTFRDIYGSDDPLELSAELCMLYFADRMGEHSVYAVDYVVDGAISRSATKFDPMRYLTDEIVEWIETWVALPEIAEG